MKPPNICNYIFTAAGILIACGLCIGLTTACSMKEEIRRIEAVKQAKQERESARSSNLTGEQLFIRSCNTCHPSGRKGWGPSLADTNDKFKKDADLAAFLRKGKGIMPPQPVSVISDPEMASLVEYVRKLSSELNERSQ